MDGDVCTSMHEDVQVSSITGWKSGQCGGDADTARDLCPVTGIFGVGREGETTERDGEVGAHSSGTEREREREKGREPNTHTDDTDGQKDTGAGR